MTEKKSILVLFGSETGNCESISKRIHQEALGLGYDSKWHKLNDFKKVRHGVLIGNFFYCGIY